MPQRAISVFVTILLGTACDTLDIGHTNIGEVVKNPSLFAGKEIKVRGKVVDVLKLPLIETKFYLTSAN